MNITSNKCNRGSQANQDPTGNQDCGTMFNSSFGVCFGSWQMVLRNLGICTLQLCTVQLFQWIRRIVWWILFTLVPVARVASHYDHYDSLLLLWSVASPTKSAAYFGYVVAHRVTPVKNCTQGVPIFIANPSHTYYIHWSWHQELPSAGKRLPCRLYELVTFYVVGFGTRLSPLLVLMISNLCSSSSNNQNMSRNMFVCSRLPSVLWY